MQNERTDLEREIAAMPLRDTSFELDRRVLESIGQASSARVPMPLTLNPYPPQSRWAWMVGSAIAATGLVALSYSLGFRAGISAEKQSYAHSIKINQDTTGSFTTIPKKLQQEPSVMFQEFLASKQDVETIWGSKEVLARFETKIVYPSENKEGI